MPVPLAMKFSDLHDREAELKRQLAEVRGERAGLIDEAKAVGVSNYAIGQHAHIDRAYVARIHGGQP